MRKDAHKIDAKEWALRASFETCSHEIKQHGFTWAIENKPVKKCLEIITRIRLKGKNNV